ncbi:MAG: M24 family metallopeptidase [Candidatus Hodarchaeota archaeon]
MERFDRVREKMKAKDLSALIALSVDNATYLIGAMIPSHITSKKRRVIAIILMVKEPILIIAGMEETFARQHSDIMDIRVYQEYAEDPIDFFGNVLAELNLSGKKIGVEMEGINARDYLKLQEYGTRIGFQIEDATELLEAARRIKTSDEIGLLKKVCRISEETIQEVFSGLTPGMTEKEVEAEFVRIFSSKGGEVKRARFGSGENTGVGNPVPSQRKLNPGDLFRVDFMGIVSNYYSDLGRTGVLGKPRTEYMDIWSRLLETHMRVLDKIRPGVLAAELYELYKKDFERWGFPPAPMVGHGIGLLINEPPVLNAFNQTELAEGMVLCVEEYHIIKGKLGLHVEDTIRVTDTGYELFSNLMNTSALMVIEV